MSNHGGAKRILLVEDQELIAQTVNMALSVAGYQCEHASNGERALSIMKRGWLPNLILLDIVMPVMDGYKFLDELQKEPVLQEIPVIMLTALNNPPDVLKAMKAGAVDYCTKPLDVNDLLNSVGKYV
ncbi:MAG: response regulator [Chromatiales bacterium]|nr:response regulator [Chromatiales bacterium]